MTTTNLQNLSHELQTSYQALLQGINNVADADAGNADAGNADAGNVVNGNAGNADAGNADAGNADAGNADAGNVVNADAGNAGGIIIVALSGGKDSVFLLHTLHQHLQQQPHNSTKIIACHVNHNLRPTSHKDEGFCRQLCNAMGKGIGIGVQFHPIHLNMLGNGNSGNGNSQEHHLVGELGIEGAARTLRYNAMGEYAQRVGAKAIITAHTRNDNVETLLLDLLTGTSLVTMGGVQQRLQWRLPRGNNITIARPLLNITTQQVLGYLNHHNIRFVHDETNDDTGFRRNLIRATIAPIVSELAGAVERLQGESAELRNYLHQQTQHVVNIVDNSNKRFTIFYEKLKTLNLVEKKYIIMVLMSGLFRVESRHFTEVQRLMDNSTKAGGSRSINLPDGYRCEVSYNTLAVYHANLLKPYSVPKNRGVRRVFIPRGGSSEGVEIRFDGELVGETLTVRTRRNGDRIPDYTNTNTNANGETVFMGKKGRVKELLIAKKINSLERKQLFVVEGSGGIIYVEGAFTSHPLAQLITVIQHQPCKW